MKKRGLEEEILLSQLEDLAHSLGIKVRYEQLKKESSFFPGGLCKVQGENVLIINSKAATGDKVETMAKALITYDLGQVYMRPALREFLLKYSSD
jgi:hypothetical protein